MAQGEWGQAIARRVYAQARPGYHSVTAGSVDKVVTASAVALNARNASSRLLAGMRAR